MTSKNFTVKKLRALNVPEGKYVTIHSKSVTVTIVGDKSQLEKMTDSDLTAYVDVSDINSGGSVTKNAEIVISAQMDQCWPYWLNDDPYPVVVSVADKVTLSEASSAESSSAESSQNSQ